MLSNTITDSYPIISDQVNREQIRVILGELERVLQSGVEGAVVEFGCYIGTTSLFIQRLLDAYVVNSSDQGSRREFHTYDSFEGLPPKSPQDESPAGIDFQGGELAVSKKQFIHEFQKANLQVPKIHKAWFSELGNVDVPEKVALAFLDGDFYESIHDSLRLVLPVMTNGGTIIFDDYSREALPGVAKAVKELLPKSLYSRLQVSHNLGIVRF